MKQRVGIKNNIANIRKKKGLSQMDFAKIAGISCNWLNHIECGRRKPSVQVLEKIAAELNVSLNDIFLK